MGKLDLVHCENCHYSQVLYDEYVDGELYCLLNPKFREMVEPRYCCPCGISKSKEDRVNVSTLRN